MRARTWLGAAVFLISLLVLAQALLPRITTDRLRERLERSGRVERVAVHAFPAVELLWHHADRIEVRMASYRSRSTDLGRLLGDTGDVGELDASAATLSTGLLTVHDARLRKRGARLDGSARVAESDIRAALPGLDVRPVASGAGQLELEGSAVVFGARVSLRALAQARDGRIVVAPEVPLGGLATITVFDDPHVAVDGVGARPAPGGFEVTAEGRLR
jgi:hypothetical protein